MAAGEDFLGRRAAQDVGDMAHAKYLACTGNGGEQHLRLARPLDQSWRVETDVTISAGLTACLPKIGQEHQTAALGGLAIGQQRVQALVFLVFMALVLAVLVDELSAHARIAHGIEHHRISWLTITAGAPDLLVIGLH